MWLTSLLRRLTSASPHTRCHRGRHPNRHQQRCFVPRLEGLECRALPSTFTVLDLSDSGPDSLRQAIQGANSNPGPDVVQFAPGLEGTVTLTSGQLSITDDLRIDGPGADRLVVSGNDASRVFQISSGVNVTIDGLTVTHGRADIGGGVWNDGGSLSLTNAVISHNQALGASGAESWGGGIANTGGSLILSHVFFADNQAFGTPGQTAYGGAV